MKRTSSIPLCGFLLSMSLIASSGIAAQTNSNANANTNAEAEPKPGCANDASNACFFSFDLPGGSGRMHYSASQAPGELAQGAAPESALIALHGHPRDANLTFNAATKAAQAAARDKDTLIISPLFQVTAAQAKRCSTKGVPATAEGDAVWTCGSWLAGKTSEGSKPISAFAALDALLADVKRQWPSIRSVTLAGFSAGGQMLQRSVGFAADPPAGVTLRYVIADPGTWLYFDAPRPTPVIDQQAVDWTRCNPSSIASGACTFQFSPPQTAQACPAFNAWKYGTQSLPTYLNQSATQARERYRSAQIEYLEGAKDSDAGDGTHYASLDKSCAANLQGPFRLQRGLAYMAYEQAVLRPATARQMTVIPDCAHNVACVFPSPAARSALFPAR